MPLRTTPANRKNYKTGTKEIAEGILYLYWERFPKSRSLDPKKAIGANIWLAGTSASSDWEITEHHEPGEPGWPDGGYVVRSEREGQTAQVFYDEVIIHPSVKLK